jgi:hypothetical protein
VPPRLIFRDPESPAAQSHSFAAGIVGQTGHYVAGGQHGRMDPAQLPRVGLIAGESGGRLELCGVQRELCHQPQGRHACGAGGIAHGQGLDEVLRDLRGAAAARMRQGIDMETVGDADLRAAPEGGGHGGAVGHGGDVVEFA